MQTATITAKYVNPPKSAKGPGSVKDANGVYWKCWPDQLANFQPDQSYLVGYTSEMYQGKEQHTIKSVTQAGGVFLAPNGGQAPKAPAPPPPQPITPVPRYTPPETGVPMQSTPKDINISVLALAKPYIELGQVPIEELEGLLVKIKHIAQRVL